MYIAVTEAEHKPDFDFVLTGELWDVYYEDLGDDWPC